MNVTIKDIASRAKVSHTTVSRALNDSPLISEKTKQTIKELAQEMDYVPNLSAKGLVSVRSYNIGLFFSSLVAATSADFIYTIIKTVSEQIKAPYNVIVNGIDTMYQNFGITTGNYDGVIVVSQFESDDTFIQKVKAANVPIVVINRKLSDKNIPNLYCNEKMGVCEAVEYLAQCGHSKIAFMEGNQNSASSKRRRLGFDHGMTEQKLVIRDEWIFKGDFSVESGYAESKKLLASTNRPTAIICASDAMAIGTMRGIIETGLQIPQDISVVGFDNGILSGFSIPSLTSIGRPIEQMSATAADMLLRVMAGEMFVQPHIEYETTLYRKESVKDLTK